MSRIFVVRVFVLCSAVMDAKNKLYFGDNLEILRAQLPDASVDVIYLHPRLPVSRQWQRSPTKWIILLY